MESLSMFVLASIFLLGIGGFFIVTFTWMFFNGQKIKQIEQLKDKDEPIVDLFQKDLDKDHKKAA